eukprot:15327127-Ditylum_brightwellii.AAC.1
MQMVLTFFDLSFVGYESSDRYQWEVNVQMLAKGADIMVLANEVDVKVATLRSSYIKCTGRDHKITTIVTAYQPCKSSEITGTITFHQHFSSIQSDT